MTATVTSYGASVRHVDIYQAAWRRGNTDYRNTNLHKQALLSWRADPGITVGLEHLSGAHTLLRLAATLLDADGKPLYTVHQLRHTRGTELTENGQRLASVQRVLGRTDPIPGP